MGLVPKLETSCFCCTFKTGSFVAAWFLLVGSSVQTGYYAFLVDHMYPQKQCVAYRTVTVKVETPAYRDYDYDYFIPWWGGYRYLGDWSHPVKPVMNERPYKQDTTSITDKGRPKSNNTAQHASNTTGGERTNSSNAANTTGDERTNSSNATNTTGGERTNSSNAANSTGGGRTNSSNAANTVGGEQTNSSNAVKTTEVSTKRTPQRPLYDDYPYRHRGYRPFRNRRPYYRTAFVDQSYMRPCPRDYKPFDADFGFLDFELRVSHFDKWILFFNIIIWCTMMATSILLMVGVYKESADVVTAWLLIETILLMVATGGAVATATYMFPAVPVQIGIVTILNMAIHVGIDIYLMMVVANYRRELMTKGEDDKEADAEQIVVSQ